jgi:glycerophosphoryl diester phosphodiesterase
MRTPLVVAHRGSSAANPDNSWESFESALAEGADVIECDVQSTRDGVLVIRHDLVLWDRLVCDLSVAQLTDAEPGTIMFGDFLNWAEDVAIGLLVELKDPDTVQAVGEMVAASLARERIVVGGFHGPALAELKAAQPLVRTSFMVGSVMAADELVRDAKAYRVDDVHLCWEARAPRPHRLLAPALIGELRRNGLAITLWHEEREAELRALVALEPDAICTNTPAVLRRIVDAHGARRAAAIPN